MAESRPGFGWLWAGIGPFGSFCVALTCVSYVVRA
jgi:hypothetical protein